MLSTTGEALTAVTYLRSFDLVFNAWHAACYLHTDPGTLIPAAATWTSGQRAGASQ